MCIKKKMTSGFCLLLVGLMNWPATANDDNPQDRSNYVSDASHTVATYRPKSFEHSPAAAAEAGKLFLQSLTDEQSLKVMHPLDSPERRLWTNLPAREDAGGIKMSELKPKQIEAACDLMALLLSEQGYEKMVNIMLADDQLLNNGRPRPGFGTEYFSIVIFGDPSPTKPWGIQLDGHHVGVNVSLTGDELTMSPSFIGTQPQTFVIGDKKFRPFTGEIDDAYRLVNSLSDEQRKKAVLRNRRGQIATGPGMDNRVPRKQGVSCGSFNPEQKEILIRLIKQWGQRPSQRTCGRADD